MNEKLNGFRMPAEWENQKSVWIAWPYNQYDWPGLYKFIPEVVLEMVTDEETTKGIAYGSLVGYLVESIKELKSRIETLESA